MQNNCKLSFHLQLSILLKEEEEDDDEDDRKYERERVEAAGGDFFHPSSGPRFHMEIKKCPNSFSLSVYSQTIQYIFSSPVVVVVVVAVVFCL